MRNACDPRSTHEVDEGETDAVANGEKVLFFYCSWGKWFLSTSTSV